MTSTQNGLRSVVVDANTIVDTDWTLSRAPWKVVSSTLRWAAFAWLCLS